MKKIIASIVLVALLVGLVVMPVGAWVYPDGSEDTLWEPFGPRIDKILIKLYSTAEAEWDSLIAGDIDITDWPLTAQYKEILEDDPTVNVVYMGAEYGMRVLDINNYPYATFLKTGATFKLYPNPCANSAFRHALWHIVDRDWIVTTVLGGLGEPLYTHVGSPWGPAQHPEIRPGGLLEDLTHPCNATEANRILNVAGFIDTDGNGWRNFPTGIGGDGNDIVLKFFIRNDDIERKTVGDKIATEIQEKLKIKVSITYGDSAAAKSQVMTPKDNFHLYTAGWGLSPDLDYLMLWSIDWYWHPGRPPNWSAVNITGCNHWAYEAMTAANYSYAVYAAHRFQECMNSPAGVGNIPLWISAGYTAYKKYYTGGTNGVPVTPDDGENAYRGKNWLGVINEVGTGVFGWWTFMNAHPVGVPKGDGQHMVMRWGFKTSTLKSVNPIYAEWVWDHYVLGKFYDSLLGYDPYRPYAVLAGAEVPYIAYNWTVTTYEHPEYGTCTKVIFHLRDDVYWSDGVQFTSEDVKFSLLDGWLRLLERGFPYPWWIGSVADIVSVSTPDPFTAEVYFAYESIWCVHYCGWMIMMPKHIWWPLVNEGDPYAPELPPTCPTVGTGPFAWDSCGPGGTEFVLLKRNPTYFKATPVYPTPVIVEPTEHARVIPPSSPATVKFKLDLHNYYLADGAGSTVDVSYYVWFVNIRTGAVESVGSGTVSLPNCTTITRGPWTKANLGPGEYGIKVAVHIDTGPWASSWLNFTSRFWVTINADLNLDITVDIFDVVRVGLAFGARPGDPNWDAACDIVQDFVIDIFDLVSVAIFFGWPT